MKIKRDFLCNLAMEFVLTRKIEELGELTVAGIAQELNVSRSYLSRAFKKERDFSLGKYLLREKMMRAATLLSGESQMTIKELSRKMGFLDADYFAYVFKKYFGISPGRYRESKKRGNQPRTLKKTNPPETANGRPNL